MALLGVDAETIGMLFIILFCVFSFSSGDWSTAKPIIWGPALLYEIPVQIFIVGLANNLPLLLPIGFILFLFWAQLLDNWIGMGFGTLVFLAWIVMSLGV